MRPYIAFLNTVPGVGGGPNQGGELRGPRILARITEAGGRCTAEQATGNFEEICNAMGGGSQDFITQLNSDCQGYNTADAAEREQQAICIGQSMQDNSPDDCCLRPLGAFLSTVP